MTRTSTPIAACVLLACVCSAAHARDDGRYANADPRIKAWVEGLTSKKKVPCCATADGKWPEATWKMGRDHYKVFLEGKWRDVPYDAIVVAPNLLGKAMVWIYYINGVPTVRCFLPEPEG